MTAIVISSGVFAADDNVAYLLITNRELAPAFQPLVDRRTSQGFPGKLITVEDIYAHYQGIDEPEQIRNCIIDHYARYGTQYVALGGDQKAVPVRYCNPQSSNALIPVDLYYADADGGNWDANNNGIFGETEDITETELTPNVNIGRIPLETVEDAAVYVDKILRYETKAPESFASRMFFLGAWGTWAGNARPIDFSHHDPISGAEVRQMDMYYEFIQPFWQAQPLHFLWDTYSSWDIERCGDYQLSVDHIIEKLNVGYHFVFYWGHANYYVWGMEGRRFRIKHVAELVNPIPSIIISFACSPAAFDAGDTCMSEAFLQNRNGGAVAYFGHTRSLLGSIASEDCQELFLAIFRDHATTTGEAWTRAMTGLASSRERDPYKQYYFTLHGDPCIQFLREESGRHLQLLQPKGCEVIQYGSDLYIRWNAAGAGFNPQENARLEYSPDSGQTWHFVPHADALPYNDRLFIWEKCNLPLGSTYRMRVVSLADTSVSDISDRDFTIAELGFLAVQSHNVTGISISGQFDGMTDHTLISNFDISVLKNQQVTLVAPEAPENMPELLFSRWADEVGNTLCTNLGYTFTFTYDTTINAEYISSRQVTHYYVNDETAENNVAAGDDRNDGLSPSTPKRHIKAVLDAYPLLGIGSRILVSPGLYDENLILGADNTGLEIVGVGQDYCIIDGGGRGSCITLDGFGGGVISGLTLQNGQADSGGGIYCDCSSPVIRNCTFADNGAVNRGGGLFDHRGSTYVTCCRFSENSAGRGGGVGCRASDGVRLHRCIFTDNSATYGGGFYSDYSSSPTTLINCALTGNSAKWGGAVYGYHSATTLVNCTLSQNTANNQDGAIANASSSETTLANCILWNDSPNEISVTSGTVMATYSDVQGGWPGEGNINVDPLFADSTSDDYHLKSRAGRWLSGSSSGWVTDNVTSPCIDAGDPGALIGDEPEPNGGRINMGTYGGTAEASKSL